MRFIFQTLLFLGLSVSTAHGGANPQLDLYRAQTRNWVMSHARSPRLTIAPADNDQAADLVDRLAVRNLAEMERQSLRKASLGQAPWSGYYWPTYAGQLANRYADPHYDAALTWKYNYEYLTRNVGRGGDSLFSPAEKYDLLVGDANFTLSKRMIESGVPYADASGKIPTWFGLCHGWAPASFMLPRPSRSVTVQAVNGTQLTFTPTDLKALATLLWANGAGETRFVSGRCNDQTVERDENNREKNPNCFDTNPATWHLAVVNQIGVGRRSFVMDASAGYEVWNQPVLGYHYGYVNPKTNRGAATLVEAKVPLAELRADPYAGHRAPNAVFVVNIVMSVTYVAENSPTTDATDSPENDAYLAATYSYDLELDASDGIVGGEWHSSIHPDFLWVPVQGSSARSVGDDWLDRRGDQTRWNPRSAVPAEWRRAAKMSAGADLPLARIVEALFREAQ